MPKGIGGLVRDWFWELWELGRVNCEITLEFLNNGWAMDVFDRLGLE